MPEEVLDKGRVPFQAEGRLLQELGLRLVASPEVAIVELIKNAYDADSPSCTVRLEDEGHTLIVEDRGHGMTLNDFLTKWMRIATSSKLSQNLSPKYHRRLTGAKGIGRFAVRYLGDHLELVSVAKDRTRGCTATLSASFNWPKLDDAADIASVRVDYLLIKVAEDTPCGTTLKITRLRGQSGFVNSRQLRDDVLRIVSPIQGLESGRFGATITGKDVDPGFQVLLPGEGETEDINLAKLVLGSYWARLTVDLQAAHLAFRVYLPHARAPKTLSIHVKTDISNGFFADIRYFPRRKGVFSDKGVDGRKAWRWVRDSCGVAVVDHGFRIKPYGFPNDDWLTLDIGKAHSERDWRTQIAKEHFPVPAAKRGEPADNPVLYLPYNFQLVGAVFIESKRSSGSDEEMDLVPAMDREGLLNNAGSQQLRDFVRAGIEYLANEDKAELERLAIAEAQEATRTARKEVRAAIRSIEDSPTLVASDKARIIKQYRQLADRVDEQEQYSSEARRSFMTMGLLGVVAGFMTHESKAAVHELERAVSQVRTLAQKEPSLTKIADDLTVKLAAFRGYLDYARMFVKNVRSQKEQPLPVAGQVRLIINSFKTFADDRHIQVSNSVSSDVMTPPLPVTVYSGVLLNLYTNALKAVIAAQASIKKPHICFRAWSDKKRHVIEVADNGIGIPPELHKRIWDPLYTTTSDLGNPLGSGMGLGLTLVKQVAAEFGGSASLVAEPPPGFTTCFRVVFPFANPRATL